MPRKKDDSLLDDLSKLFQRMPMWFGPLVAGVVFVGIRWGVPLLLPAPDPKVPINLIAAFVPVASWLITGLVLFAWVAGEAVKLKNRRLFGGTKSTRCIGDLSWQEFELLITEAYRRKGYSSERVGSASGDGGVDIRLTRNGQVVLVQCKHWKAYDVGVAPVRELFGVVSAERADRGILVTSGRFSREARRFAEKIAQLELIDGTELSRLIPNLEVAAASPPTQNHLPAARVSGPTVCPLCQQQMILRTARRGSNSGSQFWGCSRYPACKGTRPHFVD